MSMALIEHIEVGVGGESSVTFSSIPTDGTYTDLLLLASVKSSRAAVDDDLQLSFNASTTNYYIIRLFGTGSGDASIRTPARFAGYINGDSATSNTFSSVSLYIPNYTSASEKSYSIESVTENNATESYQDISGGIWDNASAISSITLDSRRSETLLEGSIFTLYGITAGSDGTTTVT